MYKSVSILSTFVRFGWKWAWDITFGVWWHVLALWYMYVVNRDGVQYWEVKNALTRFVRCDRSVQFAFRYSWFWQCSWPIRKCDELPAFNKYQPTIVVGNAGVSSFLWVNNVDNRRYGDVTNYTTTWTLIMRVNVTHRYRAGNCIYHLP